MEITDRLILLLLHGIAHQFPAKELVGTDRIAFENHLLDFRKRFMASFDNRRIRATRPVGFLIQLDAFLGMPPEDHGAEATVADG